MGLIPAAERTLVLLGVSQGASGSGQDRDGVAVGKSHSLDE